MVVLEQCRHLFQLGLGTIERRRPDFFEQSIDRLRRSGHLVGGHVSRIGGIPQQMGFLGAQANEIVDELFVIVRIAVVAAGEIGLVDAFAQVAPRRIGHERNPARFVERENVLVFEPHCFGLFTGLVPHAHRQTVQLVFVELHDEAVVFSQQVVAELHRSERQLLVDSFQSLFLFLVEQRTGPHETVVGLLQQPHLLGIESQT